MSVVCKPSPEKPNDFKGLARGENGERDLPFLYILYIPFSKMEGGPSPLSLSHLFDLLLMPTGKSLVRVW